MTADEIQKIEIKKIYSSLDIMKCVITYDIYVNEKYRATRSNITDALDYIQTIKGN